MVSAFILFVPLVPIPNSNIDPVIHILYIPITVEYSDSASVSYHMAIEYSHKAFASFPMAKAHVVSDFTLVPIPNAFLPFAFPSIPI